MVQGMDSEPQRGQSHMPPRVREGLCLGYGYWLLITHDWIKSSCFFRSNRAHEADSKPLGQSPDAIKFQTIKAECGQLTHSSSVHSSLPNAHYPTKGILLSWVMWQFHMVKGIAEATVITVINGLWVCYSPLKCLNMKLLLLKAQHILHWFQCKKCNAILGCLILLQKLDCINKDNIDLWV